MLAGMTQGEFAGWLAHMKLEPLPADRLEIQLAGIAATFAGALGGKDGPKIKPEDFMVSHYDPPKAEPAQMRAQLDVLKDMMG